MFTLLNQTLSNIFSFSYRRLSIVLLLLGISQLSEASKTESQAAQEAKNKHGGKVVEVKKLDDKFKVKLLLDDGRVIMVTIEP